MRAIRYLAARPLLRDHERDVPPAKSTERRKHTGVRMSQDDSVGRDYDRIAERYTSEISAELTGKPLDRALLRYVVDMADGRGGVGDLGCGPGHVTRHLAELGADAVGVDLSREMIRLASAANPGLPFVVGDLRCLPLESGSLAGAISFYSLIHFERDEDIRVASREIARVLKPGGEVVVAYHCGDHVVRPGSMWGVPVDLGFRFLPDRTVVSALQEAGLEVTAQIHREPYPGVEHPSRRTYLIAMRSG
jgi:SAM-dependent methyltransferase